MRMITKISDYDIELLVRACSLLGRQYFDKETQAIAKGDQSLAECHKKMAVYTWTLIRKVRELPTAEIPEEP